MGQKVKSFWKHVKDYRILLLMLLPGIAYIILFAYVPMGGIVLAFKNFRYADGIFGSPWTGFENFKFLLLTGNLWNLTRNTLLYNLAFIATGLFSQVLLAIILSEVRGRLFKRVAQSSIFLPHFISWVVVAAIMYNIFNFEKGVFNNLVRQFDGTPVNLYTNPSYWPIVMVFIRIWKTVGYGSVIFLAAIAGIDQEMYEAADIDGASIWQKIVRITLPSLIPTIIIVMLLNLGQVFRGDFGQFYQLIGNNALLLPTTDIIDTYVFRALMSSSDIGMGAAAGLYQSVLCFISILIANTAVKKIQPDYSLF